MPTSIQSSSGYDEYVPAADPMVRPLRTCAGCTQPLGRGVFYSSIVNGERRHICHRCLHDPGIVLETKRDEWEDSEMPYMRLRLVVPWEDEPRVLEVTDSQSVVIGRKADKFERLQRQLLSNQPNVDYVFEVVDDRRVGGIHAMLSYSRRSKTFRVMSYAKDKRRTFCDRPITAKPELMTNVESIRGFQVLKEMEYYHVMFAGTKVLLTNPDRGEGPRIIIDDIRGCMGLESFWKAVNEDFGTNDETSEERRALSDLLFYSSTQTASNPFSFDLAVNISAGRNGVRLFSQAVIKPDRAIIFSGALPGRHLPEMLERGEADPAGFDYASAIPEELEGFLATTLKDKHKDAWTHVYRVPVKSETFHGPLFMVRFLAERNMYVMISIHEKLLKTRRGDPTLVAVTTDKTHEFFASLVVVADTVRFAVVPCKRLPTKVFLPRVAIRTEDSITLEWLPAESPAPVIRYEIWEKLGARVVKSNEPGGSSSELLTDSSTAISQGNESVGGTGRGQPSRDGSFMRGKCDGLTRSLRIANLAPNTCYEWYLLAVTGDGGVRSAVCRAATSTMPAALTTGLQIDVDAILSVSEETITYAATYGDTPVAVTEYDSVPFRSNKAVRLREKIELYQGLVDHDNVARFLGGTEYSVIGSDDVIFQIRHERPMPSVASVWPRFGAPNVAPCVCHQVAVGLAFLHANGVIHRNLNPHNVVIRSSVAALEDNPDSILDATFAIANFDLAVIDKEENDDYGGVPVVFSDDNGGEGPSSGDESTAGSGALNDTYRARASYLRGDRDYLPPEILTLDDDADPSSVISRAGDVFSLGVLGLELVAWRQGDEEAPGVLVRSLSGGEPLCREHALERYVDEVCDLVAANGDEPAGQGDAALLDRLGIGGGCNDDDAITETTAAAVVFREFLAACLCLYPGDRLTAAALVEEGSVGQAWFALAGNEVDIRWKEKTAVFGNGETSQCVGCGSEGRG